MQWGFFVPNGNGLAASLLYKIFFVYYELAFSR